MICNSCGKEVKPDERFCGNCGAEIDMATMLIDDDEPVAEASAPVEAAPVQAAPVQPQYQQPVQPQYQQPQYQQPQYQQPQYVQPQYQQPMQPQYGQPYSAPVQQDTPEQASFSGKALGFGIAAVACLCTFYFSFLSIIFGALARSNASAYAAQKPLSGKAKTGSILGTVGFIAGIVLTSIVLIVVIVAIIAAAS